MIKTINIAKYNASGNDFVIFHTFLKQDYSYLAKKICNRFEGIGADGLVVLLPSCDGDVDFVWDFYNSDGSSAKMCGNASRAVAHYAFKNNISLKNEMSFSTKAGNIKAIVQGNIVESAMMKHKILGNNFDAFGYSWFYVDTGVPHLVALCDDISEFDLEIASKLRYEYNSNVNFASVKNNNLYVRTYERGVEAETQACGTGMCASFLFANQQKMISSSIDVYPLSSEKLSIKLIDDIMYFKGKVSFIFYSFFEFEV